MSDTTPLTASERHALQAMSNANAYADDRVKIVAQDWIIGGYSTPISGDQLARRRAAAERARESSAA